MIRAAKSRAAQQELRPPECAPQSEEPQKTRARKKKVAEQPADESPSFPAAPLIFQVGDDPPLSRTSQTAYLMFLTRGASPAAACQSLGCSIFSVLRTLQEDDDFAAKIDQANRLLSQNVAAALYRSAMQGSVSAQTFYLKNRPPPDWTATQKKAEQEDLPADGLDDLDDETLKEAFRNECTESQEPEKK